MWTKVTSLFKRVFFGSIFISFILIIQCDRCKIAAAAIIPQVKTTTTTNTTTKMYPAPLLEDFTDFDRYLSSFIGTNDKLALLLDFDGTLAPITTHPNLAAMQPDTEKVLFKLATHPNVFLAIISGRGPQDVKSKVAIDNIIYAGNHGLEIFYPDGSKYTHELSDEIKEKFVKMVTEMEAKYSTNGAWVENKLASLTFHYRDLPENLIESMTNGVLQLAEKYGFNANQAHCSIEVKPPVQWNKGEAALLILRQEFGKNWHEHVKVMFAGDDTTDEDAMRALKGKGISFRVSESATIFTNADYRLKSTKIMTKLLKWLDRLMF